MTTINRPNWVRERAECEVSLAFERLCEEVKTDVEEMQNYVAKFLPPRSSLKIERQKNLLVVRCESDYVNTPFLVRFDLNKTDKTILVEVEDGNLQKRIHSIKTAWNLKREWCELFFDDDPLEPWAVSKMVLAPLFFREG